MPSLETWINEKTSNNFIPVTLPEWYLQQVHQLLGENLELAYRSLNDYVEDLRHQFSFVYSSETHQEIINYVAAGHDFTTYVNKVEEFKTFFMEINKIVNHLDYKSFTKVVKLKKNHISSFFRPGSNTF